MSFLNSIWYGQTLSSYLLQLPLLPFSSIFGMIAAARRTLYANDLCHKVGPVVPVVVVGGLTVGGTGKTPICVALVKELQVRGFKPGILSRGYKSHCSSYPCQVPLAGDPFEYGDEPCLMRRATKVPVVIDPKRTRGADYLASLGVDVIITDDGLQHYALDRDVEICVLDGSRMLGNGFLLPAGPLREAKWRLKTVDSIVVSGSVAHLGHIPMMLKPSGVTALNDDSKEVLEPRSAVCALAGIGNPERFYKTLEDYGFMVAQKVDIGDHNKISIERLQKLANTYPVVMTAKDAIKYQQDAKEHNISRVFVLHVNASLSKQFYNDVVNKIKQSSYKVAKRRKKREKQGYVLQPAELLPEDQQRLAETSAVVSGTFAAVNSNSSIVNSNSSAATGNNPVASGTSAATVSVSGTNNASVDTTHADTTHAASASSVAPASFATPASFAIPASSVAPADSATPAGTVAPTSSIAPANDAACSARAGDTSANDISANSTTVAAGEKNSSESEETTRSKTKSLKKQIKGRSSESDGDKDSKESSESKDSSEADRKSVV